MNTPDTAAESLSNQIIIVMQAGHSSFGVIVDRVFDTEEIVVKPVSRMLRDIDLFSGNTILGDGSVIMILDPNGLARVCGELNAEATARSGQHDAMMNEQRERREQTALLLFMAGDDAPKAIALSLIDRLENIKMRDIEYADGQRVVQYRGGLMPLVPFSADQDLKSFHEKPVLVFSSAEGRSFGLIVDKIIDIREEVLALKTRSRNIGVLGSTVIDGKATDIIDLSVFYDGALSNSASHANANNEHSAHNGHDALDLALLGEADLQALLNDTGSAYPNGAISPEEGEAA
ncbi:MAG: chemotaxis protein CheW [Alphaproteobacteria bacterium]